MIRRRLVAGTLNNFVGKLTAVGTWFVLTPFILSQVGPNGYALWIRTGAIASYGFLIDFGIGGAVVKYVAEYVARGEREMARALIASALWLYVGLAIAAAGLSIVIAPGLVGLLGVGADGQSIAVRLVILTGVNVATTIAFTPPMSVLRGLQRYDLYNGVSVLNSFVEAAATVTALVAGWGVVGMVAMLIPANVVTGAASTYLLKRVAPDVPLGWRGANMRAVRRILSFSSSLFAIDIAGRLQTKTDEFIIAVFRTLSAVTPYALARKLGDIAELAAVQFLKVIMPLASELDAVDHASKLRTLYIVASRVALAIAVPVAVVLVISGGAILELWVGAAYTDYAGLLAVLAIARLLASSQWPAAEILLGMSRHRIVASIALGAGVAHIALAILLLPTFGLLGVALGTLIPTACASLCVTMPFANRTLHVSPRTALSEIWAPGLVPGVGAAAVLWIVQRHMEAPSTGMMLSWVLVTLLVYATGYLSMPATRPERHLLIDVITNGSRHLRRLRPDVSRLG